MKSAAAQLFAGVKGARCPEARMLRILCQGGFGVAQKPEDDVRLALVFEVEIDEVVALGGA